MASAILGGGIYNSGTLTVADCTISGDSASDSSSASGSGSGSGSVSAFGHRQRRRHLQLGHVDGRRLHDLRRLGIRLRQHAYGLDRKSYASGTGSGGGIFNSGTLTVADSTISGDSASGSGVTKGTRREVYASGTGSGGGIFNSGTLTVADSTISGDSASGYSSGYGARDAVSGTGSGGGIYNAGTVGLGQHHLRRLGLRQRLWHMVCP